MCGEVWMNEAISHSANKDKLQYLPYWSICTRTNRGQFLVSYRNHPDSLVKLRSIEGTLWLRHSCRENHWRVVTSPFPGSAVQANQLTSMVTSCKQGKEYASKVSSKLRMTDKPKIVYYICMPRKGDSSQPIQYKTRPMNMIQPPSRLSLPFPCATLQHKQIFRVCHFPNVPPRIR